jgi:predicted enzyme related to lactoylglutathione lyase
MASNRVVHFEIPAHDPKTLTDFYREMFGWQFQLADVPGVEYWLCDTGTAAPGINGAIMKRQSARQPVTNYVEVADVDETLAKAVAFGGQVALPTMVIPGVGSVGAILDPQGNLCGVFQPLPQP